ncbi:MAG: hypothetical protein AABO58_00715 [Acidobacteriota bacterium]
MRDLVDWFLAEHAPAHARAAIAGLHHGDGATSPRDAYRKALRDLDGPDATLAGYLAETGEEVRIGLAKESRHSYTGGITGGGKSVSLVNTLGQRFRASIAGKGIEAEVLDPKTETFVEMKLCIAAIWLQSDGATRARIPGLVHVIDWTKDKITPVDPLDMADDAISPAYAAELHTRITIETSDQTYTESLRQLLFMWDLLLIDLAYPDLFPFTLKFLRSAGYRSTVLQRVKNPDVRQFFSSLEHIVAKATVEAFLRRKWGLHAFPEYRYATCVPPRDLAKLGMPTRPTWTLANFGTTTSQPASLGHARFRWHAVRRLLSVLRRTPDRPLWFVLEEFLLLVANSPEIIEIVNTSLRVTRSAGVSLKLVSQSLIPQMPRPVVENVLLNTHLWSIFGTRPDEAELLYPNVLRDPVDRRTEGERKRAFLAEMQSLPRQHFYLFAKGHPAMRCRTPDIVHPTERTHRSKEELLGIFDREVAPHSMISFDHAARLIAEWEREVVGEEQIAENPPRAQQASAPNSLDQLRKILGGGVER